MTTPVLNSPGQTSRRFATTRWSLVLQARSRSDPPARAALAELCEAYWLPLYAFIRSRVPRAEDAQDLTQAFFETLLSRDYLADVEPQRGRFRSFLLAAVKHFLSNERDRQRAIKRGGRVVIESLDFARGESRFNVEPASNITPERLFEREWAIALLDRVLGRLRREYESAGRQPLFDALSGVLAIDREHLSYADLGARIDLTEQAARVAAHRLRKRYRHLLRDEIARTTASAEEVEDEIRCLFAALART